MRKNVIITGGTRGIGRAIVEELSLEYNVIFTYLKSKEEAQKLENLYSNVVGVQCDISSPEEVKNLGKYLKEQEFSPDCLINNAGVTHDGYIMTLSDNKWNKVIDTNLNSIFYMTKMVSKKMKNHKKEGAIINISSISGIIGVPGQINYSSAKGGVNAFTKTAAKELAPYKIRVNSICPGFIETDMTRKIPQKKLEEIKKSIPADRFGSTKEIAELVKFLISDSAKYIVGQNIIIDGGLTI